jgi:hypothetical protein
MNLELLKNKWLKVLKKGKVSNSDIKLFERDLKLYSDIFYDGQKEEQTKEIKPIKKVIIYGVVDKNGKHKDIGSKEIGVKRWATINNYNKITRRIGNESYIIAEKVRNHWVNF